VSEIVEVKTATSLEADYIFIPATTAEQQTPKALKPHTSQWQAARYRPLSSITVPSKSMLRI
jgi:hypothetical protein